MQDLMKFFDPSRKGQSGIPVLVQTDLGKVIGFITVNDPLLLPNDLNNDPDLIPFISP